MPTRVPLPPGRARPTLWWRRRRILAAVGAILFGLLVATTLAQRTGDSASSSNSDAPAVTAPRLAARGVIRPLAQARVGTVNGGVLDRLSVVGGDRVPVSTVLGLVRSRSDGAVEVLTAPISGTVLSLPASVGDTLAPGAVVAVIADLSKLQAETTDLDEFLVARVQPGQRVMLNVPALDNRQLRGVVHSVALRPEVGTMSGTAGAATSTDSYPAVIDITDAIPADLRVGMGVRLTFDAHSGG